MINILLHDAVGLFNPCHWFWLWTLLPFLLGGLLGWLLSRGGNDCSEIEADRDRWHKQATKWETDYQSLKYQLEESQKAEADLRAALQRCEADKQVLKASAAAGGAAAAGAAIVSGDNSDGQRLGIVSDGGAATGSVYDGMFNRDNFQIIEGIGPKVNEVLINAGYRSWDDLAAADTADLRRHLDAAGSRFSLNDPTSWPHQAKLAAAGDWDELIRYQKFTDAGRETTGDFETDSKFEKMAAKKLGFSSANPNDLKVVEGIGPKIEKLLKDAGINTWQELSQTSTDRIQEVLTAAGSRYALANPRTWAQQASLAAQGRWAELQTLQNDLRGGV